MSYGVYNFLNSWIVIFYIRKKWKKQFTVFPVMSFHSKNSATRIFQYFLHLQCAQSLTIQLTKCALTLSAEAFCSPKRSKVKVQAQCAHRLNRKLPQKLRGWLVFKNDSSIVFLFFTTGTHPPACPPLLLLRHPSHSPRFSAPRIKKRDF